MRRNWNNVLRIWYWILSRKNRNRYHRERWLILYEYWIRGWSNHMTLRDRHGDGWSNRRIDTVRELEHLTTRDIGIRIEIIRTRETANIIGTRDISSLTLDINVGNSMCWFLKSWCNNEWANCSDTTRIIIWGIGCWNNSLLLCISSVGTIIDILCVWREVARAMAVEIQSSTNIDRYAKCFILFHVVEHIAPCVWNIDNLLLIEKICIGKVLESSREIRLNRKIRGKKTKKSKNCRELFPEKKISPLECDPSSAPRTWLYEWLCIFIEKAHEFLYWYTGCSGYTRLFLRFCHGLHIAWYNI